jgi:uncharacterized membrane protein
MQSDLNERIQQKETQRIESFSDGVFCVAITLLALEIGLETKTDESNGSLTQALIHLWPKYLSYFISFVNVLLAWIGHHGLFKNLRNTNNYVMISNGFLLMLIALVPFPTRTLGQYLLTGAFKTAVVFYTGYFVLISIAFRLLWFAASRSKELLIQHITEVEINKITRNENLGLICNFIILIISLINPWIALFLSFIMWVYWIVLN